MSALAAVGAIVAGYLAGSFPTGVLVARARGVDITRVGSGNIGATNVARALGKTWGVFVLLVDALKGFVPVLLAKRAWLDVPRGPGVIAAIGLLAILGHVFPIWLRFRGGKGVATAFGVFLALSPIASAVSFGLYAAIFVAKRISSLGSLAAATAMPITLALLRAPGPFIVLALLGWLLIVVRHRANIRRLIRHEERQV